MSYMINVHDPELFCDLLERRVKKHATPDCEGLSKLLDLIPKLRRVSKKRSQTEYDKAQYKALVNEIILQIEEVRGEWSSWLPHFCFSL